ncbi:MAG: radical SAM protein [Candidatus Omnitrophota bacterium]|nr:radical SAM protein [Candidatus Omnitrophota bacterium]
MMKKIIVNSNSNYHRISGKDLLSSNNVLFSEYREKWKEWPEKFCTGDFPLFIDIETTSVCNLSCSFCATTFRGSQIKKGFMQLDTAKKIIDEGADNNLYGVKFSLRGEPLLHPEIHRFVEYAKKKGLIDVYFNTNAALLSEEISKKLIDTGLDRISISFEGHTKEIYERYRVGSGFEKVVSNIENMQTLKRRYGVKHPKIRVQTVMLPDIEASFDSYKKFWSKRADEVGFLDYKDMKDKKMGVRYPWACSQIWQRMAVWWDGTILPCNHDDDGLLMLGNVMKGSIKKAWRSKKLSEIRNSHRDGRADDVLACDGCYLRDSEILKLMGRERKT